MRGFGEFSPPDCADITKAAATAAQETDPEAAGPLNAFVWAETQLVPGCLEVAQPSCINATAAKQLVEIYRSVKPEGASHYDAVQAQLDKACQQAAPTPQQATTKTTNYVVPLMLLGGLAIAGYMIFVDKPARRNKRRIIRH